ncbi:MAG: transglutaminase family protein [Actinomycetota bacterium]
MIITIRHETHYRLAGAALRSTQYLRLTPRSERCQSIRDWSITGVAGLVPWRDGFGNTVHLATIPHQHNEIAITVEGEVETIDTCGVLPLDDGLPPRMFLRQTALTAPTPELAAFAAPFAAMRAGEGDVATLHRMMAAVAEAVAYQPGHTDAATPAAEAFALGRGVCQDHAHVFISACRAVGVPCRYVSGYMVADDLGQASHAWAEAFVPDLGWVSFDPSNRRSATDAYVRLAVGHDYAGCSPVVGSRAGGLGEELSVRLQVQQMQE